MAPGTPGSIRGKAGADRLVADAFLAVGFQ